MFILWAELHGVHINTAFHILAQLEEQAKSSSLVITTGGIITALAHGQGLGILSPLMPILHEGVAITWLLCAYGHFHNGR